MVDTMQLDNGSYVPYSATWKNETGLLRIEKDEMRFDSGIASFMFVATAMVQLMTMGLGIFYGGLVGVDNVTNIMLMCLITMGVIFCIWVFVGFSLTFGTSWLVICGAELLGNPSTYFMWHGVDIYEPLQKGNAVISAGFPGLIFAAYQGMFAVISPAIISGAFAGRLHLSSYLVFAMIWSLLVYAPLGFWCWGGGWMSQLGAWDFAGGIVVHESAGFAALAGVLVLGGRVHVHHNFHELKTPHNMPMVAIGTGILWFGWFGFNAGSAFSIGGLAGIAFVNSQIAPSIGMVVWVILDRIVNGKVRLLGACGGVLAGLVAITPGAGFMQPDAAFAVGALGSVIVFFAVHIAEKYELDDAVDAFTVHGIGGLAGTILLGAFADGPECLNMETAPEWCSNPGTISRSFRQVCIQTLVGCVSALYSFTMTFLFLKIMNCIGILPILTDHQEQLMTKDIHQHSEVAYNHPAINDFYKDSNVGEGEEETDGPSEADGDVSESLGSGRRVMEITPRDSSIRELCAVARQ